MSIVIQSMQEEYVEAVVKTIHSHVESDGKEAAGYFEKYFASKERVASTIEQNFVALIEDTNTLVGICGFQPDENRTKHLVWLTWFYVHPDYCGRGIGRQLLTHTLDTIRAIPGITKVYLDTASPDTYKTAIRTYKQFGFEIEAYHRDYYGENEHYIAMCKNLD